jgi:biopolymer transport protein ExbD
MSSSIGASADSRNVNVEINIVPFIDLMSCMTAFLLVTAVWVNTAQLENHPGGRARDHGDIIDPLPQLSMLVDGTTVMIGASRIDDFEAIPRIDGTYDWAHVEASLRAEKATRMFGDTPSIEIAANSTISDPVAYASIVTAMDVAIKAGFSDVAVVDPRALSSDRFRY